MKITALKNHAWANWKGFPNQQDEAFRYISFQTLQKQKFTEHPIELQVDAPLEITVLPLTKAYKTYEQILDKRNLILLKKEKNPFVFLNHAVGVEGLFIYVPPNIRIENPVKIIQKMNKSQSVCHPRIEIFVGKGAELTTTFIIETNDLLFWNNMTFNVTVEEGGFYQHYDQALGTHQSWDFLSFRGQINRDAKLNFFSFGRGSQIQRRDLSITLQGKNAEANLKGMLLLNEKKEGHVYIRIDHIVPKTRSHQLFQHIVSDRARSSFEGKIFIDQDAQKTEAYQLNKNLILSKQSRAFSKPNLEIFADDVQASHGATIVKPRLEELFYLRSRGLSQQDARGHIVRGFCRELLKNVQLKDLYELISGEIDAYLL